MLDVQSYGGAQPFVWTHDYLVKMVGTGDNPAVKDPILLNAFRAIDRADFVPTKHKSLAHQDKLVELGYGEVMTNPSIVARQLQLFNPKYGGKYLHLGSGTGYTAAILGFVAGEEGKVYSLERIQWLWEQARAAIQNYPELKGLEILYRDGAEGLADKAPFDGIIYSYAVDNIPEALMQQLEIGGKLIAPYNDHTLHIIERTSQEDFLEEVVHGFNSYGYGTEKQGRI